MSVFRQFAKLANSLQQVRISQYNFRQGENIGIAMRSLGRMAIRKLNYRQARSCHAMPSLKCRSALPQTSVSKYKINKIFISLDSHSIYEYCKVYSSGLLGGQFFYLQYFEICVSKTSHNFRKICFPRREAALMIDNPGCLGSGILYIDEEHSPVSRRRKGLYIKKAQCISYLLEDKTTVHTSHYSIL